MSADSINVSVVVPVYGCRACLSTLCERVHRTLQKYGTFEIILVDDNSPDEAWIEIQSLSQKYKEVKGVKLSRNFGQHMAITAGLSESAGRHVVVMDCDLQDPPEQIPNLLAKAESGFDIVFARRKKRSHTGIRILFATIYSSVLSRMTKSRISSDYGSFSVLTRRVVNEFLKFRDTNRHYLYILRWMGFSNSEIEYDQPDRFAGKSSYTFKRLIQHAMGGMFFQTNQLLKLIVALGFFLAGTGILIGLYFIFSYFNHSYAPGWTSIAVLLLFTGGLITTSVGVCGLYIGEIFNQVKERPLFIVQERVGSTKENS